MNALDKLKFFSDLVVAVEGEFDRVEVERAAGNNTFKIAAHEMTKRLENHLGMKDVCIFVTARSPNGSIWTPKALPMEEVDKDTLRCKVTTPELIGNLEFIKMQLMRRSQES